jgi:hypothetical protein
MALDVTWSDVVHALRDVALADEDVADEVLAHTNNVADHWRDRGYGPQTAYRWIVERGVTTPIDVEGQPPLGPLS